MNKTDLLLQMTEQPHRYTADEWQEILADDECRELYTLMSKTQSAVDAARADEEVTDDIIDMEWQRLAQPNFSPLTSHLSPLYKFAAVFVGILMLSGIGFAAIHIVRQNTAKNMKSQTQEVEMSDSHRQTIPVDTIPADTATVAPVTFDNVPFDKMMVQIARHYQTEVVFQKEETSQLRFYFVWYREQPLEKVVETLNRFEHIDIIMEDNKLIVR